jgi:hypothetical protein
MPPIYSPHAPLRSEAPRVGDESSRISLYSPAVPRAVRCYISRNPAKRGRPPSLRTCRDSALATRKSTFPSTVSEISPTFVEIYDQAIAAETHDLSQLVGIGLRKALEFLVKDFASREAPEKQKEIRDARLAICISKYVSDANVQACCTRAAWLGNDETHYTRKWEDKDINDLKLLVRLTVNWMDNILLTKKYVSEMESSGKKEGA